jgi:bla regulator protein blaR1
MAAEILSQLWQCTLAVSCAVVLIVLMRVPLRQAFGARAACWVWTLVPLSLLAVLLPRPHAFIHALATVEEWSTAVPVLVGPARQELYWPAIAISAWLVGSIAMLCVTGIRQQRFLRSLGPLVRGDDGLLRSHALTSPLVVGAFRPRLIVPADFEQRYSAQLSALMLAHEQKHLERGDTRIAAVAALLVCIFWFNPLVYYALRLLRMDQEMACDAATLAHSGAGRKHYAEALIDTQLAEQFGVVLPVGCHWGSAHPLKARISMLKNPLPGRARMVAGIVTAGLISTGAAMALWAAQPTTDSHEVVVLSLKWNVEEPKVNGYGRITRLSRDNMLVPLGTELVSGFGQSRYNVSCTPSALAAAADGAAQWLLQCKFLRDGKVLALPTITTSEGQLPSMDMTDPETHVRLYLVVNASSSPERIRLARQNAAREAAMPPSAPVLKQSAPSTPQVIFP